MVPLSLALPPGRSAAPAAAAAAADTTTAKQQQQQQCVSPFQAAQQASSQQGLGLEGAPSGCLGLFESRQSLSFGSSSGGSFSSGTAKPAGSKQSLPPTHLFSVSAGVAPAVYWLGR
jgi:hypothetical protein